MNVSLTGDDTIIVGTQLMSDFATGVVAELVFNENFVKVVRGKNGNTVFALNNSGWQSELKIKVLLAKSNDKYLNAQMALLKQAFSAYILLNGVFIKNTGDGFGNITPVTYIMSQGMPFKMPGAQSVAEGVPEQSLVEWQIVFANNDRTIG